MNLRFIADHLRVRPFPGDTEAGRSAERYRRALLTAIANIVSRAVSMLVMVLSVSWTVPYLGPERFGAWMTIASFAAMLSFLDLGIGNAMTNRIAQIAKTNSDEALRRVISGGLGVLLLVGGCVAVCLLLIAQWLPWASLIKAQSALLPNEVRDTASVFCLLFSVSLVTNGVAKIFSGLQRGFEVHVAGVVGALCSLAALWLSVRVHAGLPILLACSLAGGLLANAGLWILLWLRNQYSLRGLPSAIRTEAPHLLAIGGLFFLLQLGTMVGWGMDSLIVAGTAGAVSVAAFSVTQRLNQFVSQPLAIANAPLWSAYADAHAHNEKIFIRNTLRTSFRLTLLVAGLGCLLIWLLGPWLIDKWTRGTVTPTYPLIFFMGLWMVLECAGNALAMLLNGLGVVREQVFVVCAFIAIAMPLKYWGGYNWGATGLVLASIASYVATTVFGYGVVFRRKIMENLA